MHHQCAATQSLSWHQVGQMTWPPDQTLLGEVQHSERTGNCFSIACMALWDDEVDAEVSWCLTAKATAPATTAAAGPAEEPDEPSFIFQGFFTLPPHHTSSKAISPVASLAMSTAPALCSLHMATAFQHAEVLQDPTGRHIPHECVTPGKETGLQALLITKLSAPLRENPSCRPVMCPTQHMTSTSPRCSFMVRGAIPHVIGLVSSK